MGPAVDERVCRPYQHECRVWMQYHMQRDVIADFCLCSHWLCGQYICMLRDENDKAKLHIHMLGQPGPGAVNDVICLYLTCRDTSEGALLG